MSTKLVMIVSSALLGVSGVFLIFAPDLFLELIKSKPEATTRAFAHVLGALFFSYCMMNWMVKESLIGGIYNRPIAIANFTHFMIAGLSLLKMVLSGAEIPVILLIATVIYIAMGATFALILFTSPVKASENFPA